MQRRRHLLRCQVWKNVRRGDRRGIRARKEDGRRGGLACVPGQVGQEVLGDLQGLGHPAEGVLQVSRPLSVSQGDEGDRGTGRTRRERLLWSSARMTTCRR